MAYDSSIVAAIKQRAGKITDPSKRNRYTRAALQTGIVESGLQNLNYGDADSQGWRQERASLYENPTNVQASVDRFFKEAEQLDRGQASWELAADVQRPAAQYRGRYKEVAKQAASLLGGGASSSTSAGKTTTAATGSSGSSQSAAPTTSVLGDPGQAPDYTGLLSQLLQKPEPAAQQQTVAAPSFSASAPLPQGFRAATPEAQAQPEQQDGVSASLSLLEGLRGSSATTSKEATTEGANGSQPEAPSTVVETVTQKRSGNGSEAALGWAKGYVGFKETGENEGGIASYANKRFGMSKQPWCAMFTSLAITKGGAPEEARTASVAEVRRQATAGGGGYQKGFVKSGAAQAGDLILFANDHIGMVDRVEGGKVFYVGGNQSDGVTMASVPVGKGDIVRPKYGARAAKR